MLFYGSYCVFVAGAQVLLEIGSRNEFFIDQHFIAAARELNSA